MGDFNWGMQLLCTPAVAHEDPVVVVDHELLLENMEEYKEAKEVINEILASLGKGTGRESKH